MMQVQALRKFLDEQLAEQRRASFHNHWVVAWYVHTCVVALALLVIASAHILGIGRFPLPDLYFVAAMYLTATAVSVFMAWLRTRLDPRGLMRVARILDARLGLEDRLTTAAEYMELHPEHPLLPMLAGDARRFAAAAMAEERRRVFPRYSWIQPWINLILFSLMVWLLNSQWKLMIRPLWDRQGPSIVSCIPEPGQTNITAAHPISIVVEFSEEMESRSIPPERCFVRQAGQDEPLPAELRLMSGNRYAVLELRDPLPRGALCAIFVSGDVRDAAGNFLDPHATGMGVEYWVSTFRVEPEPELTQPMMIVRTQPARGEADVPVDATIFVEFNQPVSAASAIPELFRLRRADDEQDVDCMVRLSAPDSVIEIEPLQPLQPGALYGVTVESGVLSRDGVPAVFNMTHDGAFPGWDGTGYRFTFRTAGTPAAPVAAAGSGQPEAGGAGDPPEDGDSPPSTSGQGPEPEVTQATGEGGSSAQPRPPEPSPEDVTPPPGRPLETDSLPGNEHDPNLYGDPTDPAYQIRDEAAKPLIDESAPFAKRLQKFSYSEKPGPGEGNEPLAESPDGQPTDEFPDMFRKYQQLHAENLRQSAIPAVYRAMVERYFRDLQAAAEAERK